ncbi:MAG: clostripain-related cysteine peptidase [Muribaculaceae bacterium]
MKQALKLFGTLMLCLLASSIVTSCSDDEPNIPEPPEVADKYCFIFYGAGGDISRDVVLFEPMRHVAEASEENVVVTGLFKLSSEGENPNQVNRYTGENGKFVKDESYVAPENFSIVDSANLTDFIKWSCDKYPGRKYILVFAGHGSPFNFKYDLSDDVIADSRSTLYDEGDMMSSSGLARGIADSGVHLAAMIADSCLQGYIENLAEWEGQADYLVCSPFPIPDAGYDFHTLVKDLEKGTPLEQSLVNTSYRAMYLWSVYQDTTDDTVKAGTIVEVIKINDLTPLWDVLSETFEFMRNTVNEINYTSDYPGFYGKTMGWGYLRAYDEKLERKEDDPFENLRQPNSFDLPDFIRYSYMYSGNLRLAPFISRLNDVLSDILAVHIQSNGKHDYIFNVTAGKYLTDGDRLNRYRYCRFDKLTGWADLNEVLLAHRSVVNP